MGLNFLTTQETEGNYLVDVNGDSFPVGVSQVGNPALGLLALISAEYFRAPGMTDQQTLQAGLNALAGTSVGLWVPGVVNGAPKTYVIDTAPGLIGRRARSSGAVRARTSKARCPRMARFRSTAF